MEFWAVAKLPQVTVPWMVDVKKAGRYRLTLRQWPAEAAKPVEAVRAKLRIAGQERESAVERGTKGVVFELDLPAGQTELTTWLYNKSRAAGGAYFTEVLALCSLSFPTQEILGPRLRYNATRFGRQFNRSA